KKVRVATGEVELTKHDWAEIVKCHEFLDEINNAAYHPTQIKKGQIDYEIYNLTVNSDTINETTIKVEVLKVEKEELDKVKKFDIEDKFTARLDNLDYAKLPDGYKRENLEEFADDWLNRLLDNVFIDEFINQGEKTKQFAEELGNREAVLAYRKQKVVSGVEIEITGKQAGQISIYDDTGQIFVVHMGKEFNPLITSFDQAEKELWIEDFRRRSGMRSLVDEDEIWDYSKNGE
ncbi:17247_t:CDS:2, partial [Funneliformis geosporum]